MKTPFNTLTMFDVGQLRKKRGCISNGVSNIMYSHTMTDILSAQIHLKSLYKGKVTLPFTERILLLNDIY